LCLGDKTTPKLSLISFKHFDLAILTYLVVLGLGKAEGSIDASNLLKPALSRGELQCCGATTLNEYRLIEKGKTIS
jgi:ATP-dependent Clp protease ATP-binding subunit ClpA